jgi:hypothetical protein
MIYYNDQANIFDIKIYISIIILSKIHENTMNSIFNELFLFVNYSLLY